MPGGSGSPTGRMPHERSRVPHHVSGVTLNSLPSTTRCPDQHPVWAKRELSNVTRP